MEMGKNNKKEYQNAECEIIVVENKDVLTTSDIPGEEGEGERY